MYLQRSMAIILDHMNLEFAHQAFYSSKLVTLCRNWEYCGIIFSVKVFKATF